jgi:hypothetical protein
MDHDTLNFWYGQQQRPTFQCEPELKILCETFNDLWPHCTPAVSNRASWYAGLRKVLREFGERQSVHFLEWAHDEIEQRNRQRAAANKPPLTITDGHSIYFLVPEYKQLLAGQGDTCPHCGQHYFLCGCEWGSQRRRKEYGV